MRPMHDPTYKGRFRDQPRYFGREDYETIAHAYAATISHDPGVVAVYQVGEIGALGFSDIDFIVVIDPSRLSLSEADFRVDFLGSDCRYLIAHDAVFLSRNLFKQIYNLLPVFTLKKLAGIDIAPVQRAPHITQILLNDLAIITLLNEFENLAKADEIGLRNAVARVHSLKYPLRMLEGLGCKIEGSDGFEHAVHDFRSEYFQLSEVGMRRDLGRLINQAVDLSRKALLELDTLNHSLCQWSGKAEFVMGGKTLRFPLDDHRLSAIQFGQLYQYAKGPGAFSSFLRKQLHGDFEVVEWDASYLKALERRCNLLWQYHDFLDNCGICLGRVFGFGYEKKSLVMRFRRGLDHLLFRLRGARRLDGL